MRSRVVTSLLVIQVPALGSGNEIIGESFAMPSRPE